MDYEHIAKRRIKYSDDIYFLNYESIFELWLNSEKVKSFNTIGEVNKYLFEKYVNKRPARRVYVYTIYFDEMYDIYMKVKDQVCLKVNNYKNHQFVEAFQIFGGITYKDAKYYLGTDKIEKIKPSNYCELIKRFHNVNIKFSFTSSLRNLLLSKEIQELGDEESLPYSVIQELYHYASLAPIIYSETNKEFKNVYCYDFDSAYINKYFTCRFPKNFRVCDVDSKKAVLIRLRIKNIKAKNPRFCCLSVANKDCGTRIIYPTKESKRVLMAKEIVISVFWFELQMIKECYVYDEMIREMAWTAELEELPQSFLDTVAEVYNTKEQAKHCGEPYADKKVILNRIHGFFLTKKNIREQIQPMYQSMPIQIGFFTIALQRYMMYELIKKVGLNNIVSAHTDSIKTKGNFDDVVKEWNESHKNKYSDTMGVLESEGIMEKVVYFSNTRAKYIMDGQFKIKHGGIWEKDAQDIVNNYTYETLTNASNYSHTVAKAFRATEEGNYLKRYQETRIFSEGNCNEE